MTTAALGRVRSAAHCFLRVWQTPFGAWASATAASLVVGLALLVALPAIRVGDGMEYYAIFLAWTETLRPWMTLESFAAYDSLHRTGGIIGTYPAEDLRDAFPHLRVGETADFNHFWVYSLLAATLHGVLGLVGIPLGPHASFVALHAMLFFGLIAIAAACHGWRGVLAVLILTVTAPIAWYFNKVHTEFLTFCMTVGALALVMRDRLVAGSVLMAVAATQNPGLSFVPVVMLALRGLGEWNRPFSRWEVVGIVTTTLLLAAHPVYYFFRYGVVTPQLLGGYAQPGERLDAWYIWLFDPDLGLFPNWPLGIVLVVSGALAWRRSRCAAAAEGTVFVGHPLWLTGIMVVFLVASLYSHASNPGNLNTGGTPGVARYALWYLALVYPFAVSVILLVSVWPASRQAPLWITTAIVAAALLLSNLSFVHERYLAPNRLSYAMQRWLPSLYNPPPEVFAERFAGVGEASEVAATVGPDCRKILVRRSPTDAIPISVPERCPFVSSQIESWVTQRAHEIETPAYFTLDPDDPTVVGPLPRVLIDRPYAHDTENGAITYSGWSDAERDHRWSAGEESRIELRLPALPQDHCLFVDGFSLGPQTIAAAVDEAEVTVAELDGSGRVAIPLGEAEGETEVTLRFSDPHVPSASDPRHVAFAARTLQVAPCGADSAPAAGGGEGR